MTHSTPPQMFSGWHRLRGFVPEAAGKAMRKVQIISYHIILLMVQKSGEHQLRLVVDIPLFTGFQKHPWWLFGVSSINSIMSYIYIYHVSCIIIRSLLLPLALSLYIIVN